jgi:hypothetical protein
VAFTGIVTASGQETFPSPTHLEETIEIPHFKEGKECKSIEGSFPWR